MQVFVNARLHVSGGALGGGRMVEDASSVAGLSLDLSIEPHSYSTDASSGYNLVLRCGY